MQDEKIAQLKLLIDSSSLLTMEEKKDWTAMLPVMNDKQTTDLESILTPPAAVIKPLAQPVTQTPPAVAPVRPTPMRQPQPEKLNPAPRPVAVAPAAKPALSHITNLPGFLGGMKQAVEQSRPSGPVQNQSNVQPKKTPAQPAFLPGDMWAKKLHDTVVEKELEAPHKIVQFNRPTPQSASQPSQPLLQPSVVQSATIQRPVAVPPPPVPKPKFSMPQITVKPQPAPKPVPLPRDHEEFWSQLKKPAPVTTSIEQREEPGFIVETGGGRVLTSVESLTDVEQVSISTLRALGWNTVVEQLQELVKKHGYIAVSVSFEKSPLYKQYLGVGQRVLEQNTTYEQLLQHEKDSLQIPLAKQEFEEVADLLRKLQVN